MAAITEVLGAVQTALEAAGLCVEQDRQEDDQISESEGEVVALAWQGAESSTPTSCANYFWNAQVAIGAWANVTASQSVQERITAMLGTISSVLDADRTFGGKFHDSFFTAVSGLEDLAPDRGAVTVTVTVQYWTTRSDITSISAD